jgi:hypothetical protein
MLSDSSTILCSWTKGLREFDSLSVKYKIQLNSLTVKILATVGAAGEAGKTGESSSENLASLCSDRLCSSLEHCLGVEPSNGLP